MSAPLTNLQGSLRVPERRWQVAQHFEAWWWRRYLQGRDPAIYLPWKRNYWRDFLERVAIDVPDDAGVLDAGCGPAGIFTVLSSARVTGVDPLLFSYARLAHFDAHDYPNVDFVQGELESFTRSGYDYVFCLNVINHVRDMRAALRVLATALTPAGTAVISIDAHRYRLARRIFRAVPGDVLHPHQHDLGGYVAAMEGAGLEVQRTVRLRRGRLFDYEALVCTRKT